MTPAPVTAREVLRLLWEADSYPRPGNEDWAIAARMEPRRSQRPPRPWRRLTIRRNLRSG